MLHVKSHLFASKGSTFVLLNLDLDLAEAEDPRELSSSIEFRLAKTDVSLDTGDAEAPTLFFGFTIMVRIFRTKVKGIFLLRIGALADFSLTEVSSQCSRQGHPRGIQFQCHRLLHPRVFP